MKKEETGGFLKKLSPRGKLILAGAAAVLGILLIFLGGISGKNDEKKQIEAETGEDLAEYGKELEEKTEALCEAVAGVSDVRVLISFGNGWRTEYAGGEDSPATLGTGSSASALRETVRPPSVAGVGIVCRGGNDPAKVKTLTELVSTALGIPTNRVFVTGK